jgi:hypothetical protein
MIVQDVRGGRIPMQPSSLLKLEPESVSALIVAGTFDVLKTLMLCWYDPPSKFTPNDTRDGTSSGRPYPETEIAV